ncbi:MAG: GxxExxY protein [Desulfobacteraceae bacterium]|nr:MAG: GxxExxY protein [Desulfobacteraceae bacterium]
MEKDPRTHLIIGASMEVHKELGSGFLEPVYQEALERELTYRDIPFKSQPVVQIKFKGEPLKKTYQPDLICFEDILVELKALSTLTGNEVAQVINYLKATELRTGLLINFGAKTLQYKRFVH